MSKTIFGFTYEDEEFNLFICDDDAYKRLEEKYKGCIPDAVIDEKLGLWDNHRLEDIEGLENADKYLVNSTDYDIWWNLSEPMPKQEYYDIFLEGWDFEHVLSRLINKVIKERKLPYKDLNDLMNQDYDLYSELHEEAEKRLFDDDYEKYVKLWNKSKKEYLNWLDNLWKNEYLQAMK